MVSIMMNPVMALSDTLIVCTKKGKEFKVDSVVGKSKLGRFSKSKDKIRFSTPINYIIENGCDVYFKSYGTEVDLNKLEFGGYYITIVGNDKKYFEFFLKK